MITQLETEAKIRNFLSTELMKEWSATIPVASHFELDSIDQVDLRVFLEETFLIKMTAAQKPFNSLQSILDLLPANS